MRYLKLATPLLEFRTELVDVGGKDVRIWKNPSYNEIYKLRSQTTVPFEYRGLLDKQSGNIYIWRALEAVHNQVKKALGLGGQCFNLTLEYAGTWSIDDYSSDLYVSTEQALKTLMKYPTFRRLYEPKKVNEETLMEFKKVELVDIGGEKVKVFVNPRPKELKTLFASITRLVDPERRGSEDFKLRGIVDAEGNFYVWDAWEAIHSLIRSKLGIQLKFSLYLNSFYDMECFDNNNYYKEVSAEYVAAESPAFAYAMSMSKTPLTEAKVEIADLGDVGEVKVFVNPNKKTFESLLLQGTLRMILDKNGKLYVWNAFRAIHADIKKSLGILGKYYGHAWYSYSLETHSYSLETPIISFRNKPYDEGELVSSRTINEFPSIRRIIGTITEAKVEIADVYNKQIKVFIDPSKLEVKKLMDIFRTDRLRCIVDNTNKLFVWNAPSAIHSDIVSKLGVNGTYFGTIYIGAKGDLRLRLENDMFLRGVRIPYWEVKSIPSIARVFQGEMLGEDQELTEMKVEMANLGGKGFNGLVGAKTKVWVNPSYNELIDIIANLREKQPTIYLLTRCILGEDGNFYVWEAGKAIHEEIVKSLGIIGKYYGYISKNMTLDLYEKPGGEGNEIPFWKVEDVPSVRRAIKSGRNEARIALPIREAKIEKVELKSKNKTVIVLVNPRKSEVAALFAKAKLSFSRPEYITPHSMVLRTMLSDDNTLYVWNAWDAQHVEILMNTGIKGMYYGYVRANGNWDFNESYGGDDGDKIDMDELEDILSIKRATQSRIPVAEKVEFVETFGESFKVFVNPRKNELKIFFSNVINNITWPITATSEILRVIIDENDNLYFWRCWDASHTEIERKLGIDGKFYGYLLKNGKLSLRTRPALRGTKVNNNVVAPLPRVKQALGDKTNLLREAKVETASIYNDTKEVKVFVNPRANEITNLLKTLPKNSRDWLLRIIVDKKGNLYVWNAFEAPHFRISGALGIDWKYTGYMDNLGNINFYTVPNREVAELPSIKRAFPDIAKPHQLTEARIETVAIRNKDIKVWIDPSHNDLLALFKKVRDNAQVKNEDTVLRGIFNNDHLYVWDGWTHGCHYEVMVELGLQENESDYLYLLPDRVEFEDKSGKWIRYDQKMRELADTKGINVAKSFIRALQRAYGHQIKENLTESTEVLSIAWGPRQRKDVRVWKNVYNISSLIDKFGELRGLMTPSGDFYVWNSHEATHFDIRKVLFSHDPDDDSSDYNDALFDENNNMSFYKSVMRIGPGGASTWIKYNNPRLTKIFPRKLITENLTEAKVEQVNIGDLPVKVFVNPSHTELMKLCSKFKNEDKTIRGLLDASGNLYVWDAYRAVHDVMADELGFEPGKGNQFIIDSNGDFEYYNFSNNGWRPIEENKELMNVPSIRRVTLERITEAKAEMVEIRDKNVKIWKNPGRNDFFAIMKHVHPLRGIIDNKNDLYVWDAYDAIHVQVEMTLHLDSKFEMMMYSDHIDLENLDTSDEEKIRNLPAIKRAYGDNAFDIFNDAYYHYEEVDETVSPSKKYYHVTFTSNVKSIMEKGLVPGKRKVWNNAFGAKQGIKNAIYLFDNPTMAVRWGHKMEYDFDKPTTILVIDEFNENVVPDDHIEAQMNGNSWFYTFNAIPPSCIKKAVNLSLELTRKVVRNEPIDLEEGKIEKANLEYYDVSVLVNPSVKDFKTFISKHKDGADRGLVDKADNLYVWDGFDAMHSEIADSLGIDAKYWLYISNDGRIDYWSREMKDWRSSDEDDSIKRVPSVAKILSEAAVPEDFRSKVFYHGTTNTISAKGILKNGLKGQETQGKYHFAPLAGKVYITTSLPYAIIYALGGDYTSQMQEQTLNEFIPDDPVNKDPYGYVFVISGNDLVDIQPDEDSVGEFLCENSKYNQIHDIKTCTIPNEDVKGHQIYNYLMNAMTEHQVKKILVGEYSYFAAGGKRALKNMPDWMKIELINRGAHIAHDGSIRPSECWQIAKADKTKLKKDGSNFFEIAKKVTHA